MPLATGHRFGLTIALGTALVIALATPSVAAAGGGKAPTYDGDFEFQGLASTKAGKGCSGQGTFGEMKPGAKVLISERVKSTGDFQKIAKGKVAKGKVVTVDGDKVCRMHVSAKAKKPPASDSTIYLEIKDVAFNIQFPAADVADGDLGIWTCEFDDNSCATVVGRDDVMRALLPDPSDHVDLEAAYAPPATTAATRPFVRVNMISSLDGAIAVHGKSGQLGGPGDHQVFGVLRALTDMVLVGAGTVRAEGYGPVRLDDAAEERRRARGQTPVPPIAVVSRSCHLDWNSPFFTDANARPIVITTTDADDAARERAETVADVVTAGAGDVDLAGALDALRERGARSVLGEGGPRLNAQLAAAGLIDELCLTLSPRLVAGDGPRLFAGPELPEAIGLQPVSLLEDDGFFFLRLRRGHVTP